MVWLLASALAMDVFTDDPASVRAHVEALEGRVAELRGLPFRADVRVEVLDEEELRRRLIRDLSRDLPPRKAARQARFLEAFGLVPPGYDLGASLVDVLGEQVGGYYDPRTRRLSLIKRSGPTPGQDGMDAQITALGLSMEDMVTSHELVHALQDQHFGLDRLVRGPKFPTSDAETAFRALIEGDASYAMYLDSFAQADIDLDHADLDETLGLAGAATDESSVSGGAALKATPPILRDTLLFPYLHGPAFIQSLRDGTWSEIDAAFAAPPQSTEQILHPDRYASRDQPTLVHLPKRIAALGPGWKQLHADTFGELGIRTFLRQKVPARPAEMGAVAWDGDEAAAWEDREGRFALAWFTVWDGDGAAEHFARDLAGWIGPKRLEKHPDGFVTRGGRVDAIVRRGAEVVVVRGIPEDVVEAVLDELWSGTRRTEWPEPAAH